MKKNAAVDGVWPCGCHAGISDSYGFRKLLTGDGHPECDDHAQLRARAEAADKYWSGKMGINPPVTADEAREIIATSNREQERALRAAIARAEAAEAQLASLRRDWLTDERVGAAVVRVGLRACDDWERGIRTNWTVWALVVITDILREAGVEVNE